MTCIFVARPDVLQTHIEHVAFAAFTLRFSQYATSFPSDYFKDTKKISMTLPPR